MPQSYLIARQTRKDPSKLFPWDAPIPQLPPPEDGTEDVGRVQVENYVVTAMATCPKLGRYTQRLARAHTNKSKGSKFSSTRYKILDPRATTLVFYSGNKVIAGTKSASLSLLAHHSFNKLISGIVGVRSTRDHSFKIQNIVSSCHYGYKVDIEAVARAYPDQFSYDPKLFPGARGRLENLTTSVLLFSSGNGVITGAKAEREIIETFTTINAMIRPYFLERSYPTCPKTTKYNSVNKYIDKYGSLKTKASKTR